jgi:hypothetical protein
VGRAGPTLRGLQACDLQGNTEQSQKKRHEHPDKPREFLIDSIEAEVHLRPELSEVRTHLGAQIPHFHANIRHQRVIFHSAFHVRDPLVQIPHRAASSVGPPWPDCRSSSSAESVPENLPLQLPSFRRNTPWLIDATRRETFIF